jgi:hypothetical protein
MGFLLLSLALLAPAAAPEPDPEGLVDAAEQTSARMEALSDRLSRTCVTRAEQLDTDGKPEQTFEETTRSEWIRGEEVKAILSASEDGTDVTVREQEKLAATQEKQADGGVQERGDYAGIDYANPFAPDQRRRYRFSLAPAQPGDGARIRLHFEPSGERTPALNQGEALVDPATGLPVEITASPSTYPSFVAFVRFHARYGMSAVGPVETEFSVEGAGGFLFVRKHYRERTRCRDFALSPQARR